MNEWMVERINVHSLRKEIMIRAFLDFFIAQLINFSTHHRSHGAKNHIFLFSVFADCLAYFIYGCKDHDDRTFIIYNFSTSSSASAHLCSFFFFTSFVILLLPKTPLYNICRHVKRVKRKIMSEKEEMKTK